MRIENLVNQVACSLSVHDKIPAVSTANSIAIRSRRQVERGSTLWTVPRDNPHLAKCFTSLGEGLGIRFFCCSSLMRNCPPLAHPDYDAHGDKDEAGDNNEPCASVHRGTRAGCTVGASGYGECESHK
jgi:hypothetical protein